MNELINPILRGFNPDPSVVRVEEDYYIATSTFEWFPGVQIHHSTDLINWKLLTRPLNRTSQLDMLGVPDSCGVWAPCLSYNDGLFYLVYSNVRSFDGVWKDTPNYLVTSKDITGDWSEPVYLSASGFDGSLFHDDDGKKWYTSMLMDHRENKFFGGIILQEYDPDQKQLVGPVHHIFEGTELGKTEGPHIYKLNGYYYLLTAEGGTEYGHGMSIARSRSITGLYQLHPSNPLISSKDNPELPLQKAGHGDIFQSANGDWYAVFLTGRPLTERGNCILGRETAIEEIFWKEDWPYLKNGGCEPRLTIDWPAKSLKDPDDENFFDDFDDDILDINFQSLRIPFDDEWMSLKTRLGYLRLYGRESMASFQRQSMVARRLQHFNVDVSAKLEFQPRSFLQMAGLVCYYNTGHYYYLSLSAGQKEHTSTLTLYKNDNFQQSEVAILIFDQRLETIFLKIEWRADRIQFLYSISGEEWNKVGNPVDSSILSDDYVANGSERYRPAFTGSFIGMCCQDLSGQRLHADFDWFVYKTLAQ